MEKLIKLLNEYEIWKTKDKISQNPNRSRREWYRGQLGSIIGTLMNERESRLSIISKSYGFIKRLVKNDKIDFDNRELKDKFMLEFERYPTFHGNTYNRDFNENGLLMLLAISDSPISDLISVLK